MYGHAAYSGASVASQQRPAFYTPMPLGQAYDYPAMSTSDPNLGFQQQAETSQGQVYPRAQDEHEQQQQEVEEEPEILPPPGYMTLEQTAVGGATKLHCHQNMVTHENGTVSTIHE